MTCSFKMPPGGSEAWSWKITQRESGEVSTIIFERNRCGLAKALQLRDPKTGQLLVKYHQIDPNSGKVKMRIDKAFYERTAPHLRHIFFFYVTLFLTGRLPKMARTFQRHASPLYPPPSNRALTASEFEAGFQPNSKETWARREAASTVVVVFVAVELKRAHGRENFGQAKHRCGVCWSKFDAC